MSPYLPAIRVYRLQRRDIHECRLSTSPRCFPSRDHFVATDSRGTVSAILNRPPDAWCLYVLAHGAGAGIASRLLFSSRPEACLSRHRDLLLSVSLHGKGKPSPRPRNRPRSYRPLGRRRSNGGGPRPANCRWRQVDGWTNDLSHGIHRAFASFGLVFLGFPLHPAGKPSTERSGHLDSVNLPMLFLQGTRDRLADLELLRPVIDRLGDRAHLHIIADGDHSFQVLKRSGRSEGEVFEELAGAIAKWGKRALGT